MLSSVIHCTKEDENKRACAKCPHHCQHCQHVSKMGIPVPIKNNIARQPSSHRETTVIAS